MTIHCAAWPFPMTISLTSADPENADLVASGSTATINLSNYTASITYKHKSSPTERVTEIMKAINKHCTASIHWNSGSAAMDYFTGSNENKQILTASIADGRLLRVYSAHSLNLQQQRLINFTCSSGILPVTGSKVTVTNASTGGGNGRFLGSQNRNIAKHQFKPHVTIQENADILDSAERRIYESSMNNFLAETVNFFIAREANGPGRYFDLRMPMMMSDAEAGSGPISVQSGSTYYMSVNLYMGESHVMCEGPRFADVPQIRDNASSSMRGAFFGPPLEVVHRAISIGGPSGSKDTPFWNSGAFGGTGSSPFDSEITPNSGYTTDRQGLVDNITDPAYHHVTPPYFYGPSSVILKYVATSSVADLEEIWTKARFQSLYFEEYTTGLSQENLLGYTTNRFPSSSLSPKLPTPESVSTGSALRMKIEDSISVFVGSSGKFNIREVAPTVGAHETATKSKVWVMMPKWVAPVLDFGFEKTITREVKRYSANGDNKTDVQHTLKNVNPFYDNLSGKAMWLGYGFDPYSSEDKNIMKERFEAEDLMLSAIGAHAGLSGTLDTLEEAGLVSFLRGIDPTQNSEALEKKGIWFQISDQFPEQFAAETSDSISFATEFNNLGQSGYATSRSEVFEPGGTSPTGSLYNLLGFNNAGSDPLPIGKIADSKLISEAIVAIPYFDEPWGIEISNNFQDPEDLASLKGYQTSDIIQEANEGATVIRTVAGTLKNAIIPGKYFLKIDQFIFQNMLSILLVNRLTTDGQAANAREKLQYEDFTNSLVKINNTDVGKMIASLLGTKGSKATDATTGFMIPPEFDFINNAAVPAFQMVVAPFSHSLDRNDLMNIWQNLMPDVSYRARKVRSTITIEPGADPLGNLTEYTTGLQSDIFGAGFTKTLQTTHQGQFLSTWALSDESLSSNKHWSKFGNIPKSSADFFKKLRWMVFKVKQRAAQDYDQYIERQIEAKANKQGYRTMAGSSSPTYAPVDSLKTGEIYGSNWPYDFFSLLEKAKIDIEYKVDG